MENSDEIPKDRYCRSNVTIDNCSAFYVELEPLEDMRFQFMFWNCDKPPKGFSHDKARTRDLRPGDTVVFEGFRRKVKSVQI
jgi:hypothetical protein